MNTGKALVPIVVVVALAVGCDWMPGKPKLADRPLRPEQIMSFRVLYGARCAGCHGADGRSGAARPLNDPLFIHSAGNEALVRVIRNGVPGTAMPAFAKHAGGELTDKQIALLVAELRANWGGPVATPDHASAPPPYQGSGAGDASRGAKVYGTFCEDCHGPGGTGGLRAGSITDGSYLALVSDQALRSAVIFGRTDLGMPDWRGYVPGRPMTDQEVSDVVVWLTVHRNRVPGQPDGETPDARKAEDADTPGRHAADRLGGAAQAARRSHAAGLHGEDRHV